MWKIVQKRPKKCAKVSYPPGNVYCSITINVKKLVKKVIIYTYNVSNILKLYLSIFIINIDDFMMIMYRLSLIIKNVF